MHIDMVAWIVSVHHEILSSRRTEAIEADNNMTDYSVDNRSSGLNNHRNTLLPERGFYP
jgi:hypothetical protein